MGENCNRQWPIEQSDTVILNDPALLPITGVRYGPIRFDQQIAKVSISPLQCEPYTDVSLSTRLGEVNETVIEIQSALSSFEEHVNDTFSTLKEDIKSSLETIGENVDDTISTLKEDIRDNATDIWMDISNIRHDVSSLRQDVETNLTSLDDDILAINNTLHGLTN